MKTILLVDDDADFLDLTSGILEYMFGVRVLTCSDGSEVSARLKANTVDLVVTDTNMPQMNGIEVLKMVTKEYPRLPVVVLFSYLEGSAITTGDVMALGALAVVSKTQLLSVFAEIIEGLPGR